MAEFTEYAPLLKNLEGGYVYHPADKGGATNCGVTLRTFQEHFGHDKNVIDLKAMTGSQWNEVMKEDYWDVCKGDRIDNQSVAEIFIDWFINSGGIAIRKVQKIAGVKADGLVGDKTIGAINGMDSEELFNRIKFERADFYQGIVKRNPSQSVFLAGWINRLKKFVYEK